MKKFILMFAFCFSIFSTECYCGKKKAKKPPVGAPSAKTGIPAPTADSKKRKAQALPAGAPPAKSGSPTPAAAAANEVDKDTGGEEAGEEEAGEEKPAGAAKGAEPVKKKKKKKKGVGGKIGGALKKVGGALGRKKNPLSTLMKAMTQMPKIMEAFAKTTLKTTKTIMKARKIMMKPNSDPQAIIKIHAELAKNLEKFTDTIEKFRGNAAYKGLEAINKTCGTPVMSAAMSMPYVGTAVAGMCGKIATIDLKVATMLFQAESTIANGGIVNDKMQEKVTAMQSMTSGGMPGQAMMANGGGMPGQAMITNGGGMPGQAMMANSGGMPGQAMITNGGGMPGQAMITNGDEIPDPEMMTNGGGMPSSVMMHGPGMPMAPNMMPQQMAG
ncbi:MAG: hypothetical protein Q8S21_05590 [Candidatus Paracaedibacteraceae bacterium]|nr:hypothetical protein [Candidatus Paracaedibacteraceae bacterium]